MGALVLTQDRQDGVEAELIDARPVDAAEHRVGEPLHNALAEPRAQQVADRDVARAEASRQHQVEQRSRLVPQPQDRRADERPEFGR